MAEPHLRETVLALIAQRAARMGMSTADLTDDLDLLRSGLLDSLGFVDLIVDLEKRMGKEVDLIAAMDRPGGTTLGGVVELFARQA
jgi:acyl carrier protein